MASIISEKAQMGKQSGALGVNGGTVRLHGAEFQWAEALRCGRPLASTTPNRWISMQNDSRMPEHLISLKPCLRYTTEIQFPLPMVLALQPYVLNPYGFTEVGAHSICTRRTEGSMPAGYLSVTCLSTLVCSGKKIDHQLLHLCVEKTSR